MLFIERKEELVTYLAKQKLAGKHLGFVPTMGALHQGHLSLIAASLSQTDVTVCSIFVNPAQFNNPRDLEKYPRTLEKDRAMLEEAGCQVLFCPLKEEIYPAPTHTNFSFGPLETVMEGHFRPGHFHGVGLVVSKLFHLVNPDKVFFGQKDLQQCRIVQQLVNDLSFPLEVYLVPTVREVDGLAMSSRNIRLSAAQRAQAGVFYQALRLGEKRLKEGVPAARVQDEVEAFVAEQPLVQLEYFCIADGGTLQPVEDVQKHSQLALCIAGYLGDTRLIDNLLLEV